MNYESFLLYFASILCFITVFLYFIRIPFPPDTIQCFGVTCFEIYMRLCYKFPAELLEKAFGNAASLYYSRKFMAFTSKLIVFTDGRIHKVGKHIEISDRICDGISVRVYWPKPEMSRRQSPCIIYVHGGGFVLQRAEHCDMFSMGIAKYSRVPVVSINYPFAPENPFPAALNVVEKLVVHFLKGDASLDIDPTKVFLLGESAGGNMAAAVVQRLKRRTDLPPIAGQVLIYPWLQFLDFDTPAFQQWYKWKLQGTAYLGPEYLARWLLCYAGVPVTDHHIMSIASNNHIPRKIGQELTKEWEMLNYATLPEQFRSHLSFISHDRLSKDGDADTYEAIKHMLLDPDAAPLMAKDLRDTPPTLIQTVQYDVIRDDGYWYHLRLLEAGVESDWQHYGGCFHCSIHVPSIMGGTIARDAAAYIRRRLEQTASPELGIINHALKPSKV